MRFYVHLLCLVVYAWAVTCVGQTLLVDQHSQDDSHVRTTLVAGQDQSWAFHHVGHRDQHEPKVQDTQSAIDEQAHGDHVVKRNSGAEITTLGIVEPIRLVKVPEDLLAAPPPSVLFNTVAAPIPGPSLAEPAPPTRNSSLAIVKLTRLRI
jgi:hypothetical protein